MNFERLSPHTIKKVAFVGIHRGFILSKSIVFASVYRRQLYFYIALFFCCIVVPTYAADVDIYQQQRQKMVSLIEDDVKETSLWIGKEQLNNKVMWAMGKVPRHEFVPASGKKYAYENRPLPIGYGQTISQPYIVALMTDLADIDANGKVLEVGTGSGYQAAILSEIAKKVYTIEIIAALGEQAKKRLKRLGYDNVMTQIGDGYYGWEEAAPFDAILVTAAASHIPPPLLDQLKPGGRMVIPVGSSFFTQQLMLVEKSKSGKLTTHQVLPVRFVPLTGKH